MVLSIIICTYNRVKFLELCVNSILNQIKEKNIELIIIDNNSNDNTKQYIKDHKSNIIKYYLEEKQGLSFARNKGIEVALGTYLAFIDDDATISDKWLDALLSELKKERKEHIYGGPIYPNFEVNCPSWIDPKYFIRSFKDEDGYLDTLTANDGFSGGNMCIPKTIFKEAGKFNTNLGMKGKKLGLGEESELFYRILKQLENVKLYNISEMSIIHFEAKFKMEKEYVKERISLSAIQFNSRLLNEKNIKSYILVFGKLIKQTFEIPINLILSYFRTENEFKYFKNLWIVSATIKTIFK